MDIQPEVIDINNLVDDTPVINLNDKNNKISIENKPSVNFGDGIELLMNEKRKSDPNKKPSDINIDDLNNLEDELNELTDVVSQKTPSKSGLFNDALNTSGGIKFNINDDKDTSTNLKKIDTDPEPVPMAKVTADKTKDVNKFKGASLIKPNSNEASKILGVSLDDLPKPENVVENISKSLDISNVLYTRNTAKNM